MNDADKEPLPPGVAAVLSSGSRLQTLHAVIPDMAVLDSEFDGLANIAAGLFEAPVALVTVVDTERQWFKSRVGTPETVVPTIESFCVHTIAGPADEALVVGDATQDPRFANQPRVAGEPGLRFYAGVPIIVDDEPVGTVCVLDVKPRGPVEPALLDHMRQLATLAATLFKLKEDARRRALKEAALSRDEQRHATALEAANVGSWLWDIRSGLVTGNSAMMRMFCLSGGTPVHQKDILSAIHPDDRSGTLERLRTALEENKEYDGLFRIQASGRWLLGRGRVHERDTEGNPTLFLGINIDVTQEQTAAQRTRLLLRELNHRVKNTLAMLQSLARQTLRQTSDPQQFMTAFAGRLQAISEAHGLLSDHEWDAIRLSSLLAKQVSPHVRDYERQVEIHKDEISLGPDQAVGLGLVLHELATNAAKYGSLSVPGGRIVITARQIEEAGENVLNLTWTEVNGPPVKVPERRGFGSILIERSLDKVLGSSVNVEYLEAGVTAIIRLPLKINK